MPCCAPSIGSIARRCAAGCSSASRTVFTRTRSRSTTRWALILREFDGGAVRYWHDVGHALNHQRLGIGSQEAWLEAYGTRLAGTHLHDIRGGEDHLAPGTGEADFAAILRHLPADAIKIMEVRSSVPREELLAARDMLRGLGY